MKPGKFLIAALCAGMACAVLPARAADSAEKKKDVLQPLKPAVAATPAAPGAAVRPAKQGPADRHAKAMEAASNQLKKTSDTSDSVIKNTK